MSAGGGAACRKLVTSTADSGVVLGCRTVKQGPRSGAVAEEAAVP